MPGRGRLHNGAKARGGRGRKKPRKKGLTRIAKEVVARAKEDLDEAMTAQEKLRLAWKAVTIRVLKTVGEEGEPEPADEKVMKQLKLAEAYWETKRKAAIRDLGLTEESRAEASESAAPTDQGSRQLLLEGLGAGGSLVQVGPGAAN